MDELQNKLLEYLSSAEKALTDLGPKAWEATVGLVHLNAWLSLFSAIGMLVLAIIVAVVALKVSPHLYKEHKRVCTKHSWGGDCETPQLVLSWILGILGVVLGLGLLVFSAVGFFSKSMWIALVNPELGLLWEVYQKFIAS